MKKFILFYLFVNYNKCGDTMKEIMIITGASSGMGKEFARQIEKKYKVDELWVIARRKERLESLKEMLETIENMMNLNMLAVVKMVNTVLPYMHKESHIVNFASCSGYMPIPYLNIYAASKAFVLNYSRALNEELKYRGIHVLAICPYWVETEFFDRAVEKDKKPVVIRYGKVYQAKDIIKKAIKDMERSKDVSLYGTINRIQILGMKVLPHRFVKKIWMAYQNLDGTRKIR